ncbi:uncharacterized protein EV422DRAFT_524834 [Fimicolochytrium jonesii]|uniref:uncharacterized protein n=1 Tax=Fimicolochytrium jonesii TaxID=1396493 RepID=UPI0022FF3130|nr:uncharacterized protein EV422DRAFT_524834 [Fimicolochytrium jonesii]KAI8822639.1 hypothetical protein EV422DRAFT_524834 [Fimicolochytrium jonesii]
MANSEHPSATGWQPLPKGTHGVAVCPFIPTQQFTKPTLSIGTASSTASIPTTSTSTVTLEELVPLELGDAVHILERCDGWLRGYVFPTLSREAGTYLGVFPASHIYSRALRAKKATSESDSSDDTNSNAVASAIPSAIAAQVGFDAFGRPLLQRTATAPMPHVSPGSSIQGMEGSARPMSYAPGFAVGARRVLHPIPAAVRPDYDTSAGHKEILVDEIAAVLRDWGASLTALLESHQYDVFKRVHKLFHVLSQGRRTLLSQTLDPSELAVFKKRLIAVMEEGNSLQGSDLVIRHPEKGHILSERNTTIVHIYRMHMLHAQKRLHDKNRDESSDVSAANSIPQYADVEEVISRFTCIFFELRSASGSFCLVGEFVELRFSLYHHTEKRMLSEEYVVHLNSFGIPVSKHVRNGKLKTIFADIPHRDVNVNVFLLCRLVRVGKMTMSERDTERADKAHGSNSGIGSLGSSSSSIDLPSLVAAQGGVLTPYRRPLGWSVIRIGDWIKLASERSKEISMRIYAPTSESSFSTLYENIISKSGGYDVFPRGEALTISLNLLQSELSALQAAESPFLTDAMITPRSGFSDVIVPGDKRNSMYITLVTGDFSTSRKPTVRNVQVTLQVRLPGGDFVEGCLSSGTGDSEGIYDSLVYYHNTSPRWSETVRLDLAPEIFKTAHLFLTFRHCSSNDKGGEKERQERNFAFGFLPLVRNGQTVVNDSSHSLALYKYDKRFTSPAVYLQYPAASGTLQASLSKTDAYGSGAEAMSRLAGLKDSCVIRTRLCSTRLTQNEGLHKLLTWQSGDTARKTNIESILSEYLLLGELEIIKFLPKILDALFRMMDSEALTEPTPTDAQIFDALVFTFGIVMDKRFANHRPTIEKFIVRRFRSKRACNVIMHNLQNLVKDPADIRKGKKLRTTIKVWKYLLKFAIRSDQLSGEEAVDEDGAQPDGSDILDDGSVSDAPGKSSETLINPTVTFLHSLDSLFSSINEMMTVTAPEHVIGSQTLMLQYFSSVLPELQRIFTPMQLVNKAAWFVDSVRGNRTKLTGYKLILIRDLVKGSLFADARTRGILTNCATRWVTEWGKEWVLSHQRTENEAPGSVAAKGQQENLKLCCDITGELVDRLQRITEKRDKELRAEPASPAGSLEEHSAAINAIAELLMGLLEIYRVLTSDLDGSMGIEGRLRRRDRPANRSTLGGQNKDKILPRSTDLAYLAAIILSIVHLLKDEQLQSYLLRYYAENGPRETVRFVSLLCEVFGDMISEEPFSPFWVGMNMITHRVALRMLRPVSELLRGEFLDSRDDDENGVGNRLSVVFSVAESDVSNMDYRSSARSFQTGVTPHGTAFNNGGPSTRSDGSGTQALLHRLWDRYFHLLLQLLNSQWLQNERFGPQRARVAHRLGADVRGEGGEMLRTMWEHLGSTARGKALQAGFIPSLVGPFLHLTASPHPVLRSAAVELLFNTIEPEFEQVGHFGRVELECIERLHMMVTQDKLGDDAYRSFIIDALERRFETRSMLTEGDGMHDRELTDQGRSFLRCLDKFLELSLQIRDLPAGEQHDDERAEALLNILRFLRSTGRTGTYVEYVQKLVDMQLENNNPVEAALALKLHGDLFEWRSEATLEPEPAYGFPEWQTEFERKEAIYLRCMELLENGQAWERAIELCRELSKEYERNAFSFTKLSDILHRQADLYAGITGTARSQPEYYRVGFYGVGCPPSLRNRQYIYRGGDWEKLGAFCDRILQKYVGAKLARSNAYPPPVEVTEGEGIWLQVTAVKPVVDVRHWQVVKNSGPLGAIQWEQAKKHPDDDEISSKPSFEERDDDHNNLALVEPDLNLYRGGADLQRGPTTSVALEKVDERVRGYYESNEVGMFSFARPVRKVLSDESTSLPPGDPAREFLELWTEKIVLVTQDRFPFLSRRNPVVRVEIFELSPIENAVIAVRGKTRQLLELEKRYAPFAGAVGSKPLRHSSDLGPRRAYVAARSAGEGSLGQNGGSSLSAAALVQPRNSVEIPSVNPFTMALNGAVDAPVNGGVPMYKRAFLSREYRAQAEDQGKDILVNLLERAIEEQVEAIHRCLMVHDIVVPKPMRPLHEELIGLFNKNYADDITRLGLSTLRPTPATSTAQPNEAPTAAGSTPSLPTIVATPLAIDLPSLLIRNGSGAGRLKVTPPMLRRRSSGALRHSASTVSLLTSTFKREQVHSMSSHSSYNSGGDGTTIRSATTPPMSQLNTNLPSASSPPYEFPSIHSGSTSPSTPRGGRRSSESNHEDMGGSISGSISKGSSSGFFRTQFSSVSTPNLSRLFHEGQQAETARKKKDRFGALGKLFDNLR